MLRRTKTLDAASCARPSPCSPRPKHVQVSARLVAPACEGTPGALSMPYVQVPRWSDVHAAVGALQQSLHVVYTI